MNHHPPPPRSITSALLLALLLSATLVGCTSDTTPQPAQSTDTPIPTPTVVSTIPRTANTTPDSTTTPTPDPASPAVTFGGDAQLRNVGMIIATKDRFPAEPRWFT